MNIWIKRSLGTVAVTGGLLFAGATAANADDAGSSLIDGLTGSHAQAHDSSSTGSGSESSSSESSSSSRGSASAPIEVGGLDVGTRSESSSSTSSSSESTDGDRSAKESSSSQKSSTHENGLSTEGIELDPQAAFGQEQASKDSDVRTGDRDGSADSSESSSATGASASAPIRVGGIDLTSASQEAASDARASVARDGDRAVSESEESSSSNKNATDLGIGAIELDPQAAFRDARSSSSSNLGGSDGIRDAASSSASAGAASLPIRFEGISFSNDSEREQADRRAQAAVDGDRGVASEEGSSSTDTTSTALEGLGFGFAPQGAFETERTEESSRLGDRDGIRDDASSSSSSVEGAAPFSFEGLAGSFLGTFERATTDERVSVDGDRSTREVDEASMTTENGFAASGGAFDGKPTFGFQRSEDSVSSAVGDAVRGESTSSTSGRYAFPFDSEGITAVFESIRATNLAALSEARDGDRSTKDTRTESTRQHDETQFGTDGISGDPSGSFEQDQLDVTDLLRH